MKKQQWMALLLGGCLLLGLAACKQSDSSAQEEDTSKSYAEDIQKKKDAEAAEQAKQDEAKQEETKQEETKPAEDSSAEEDSSSETENNDAKPNDTEQDDANQDGEARNEISKSEAKASVIAQFGSADENGQAYEYSLDGIEQIGSHKYYIYRMSWAADDQDGGAYSKTLKYIFVATDGSTIHTGTADDDGYDIDYSS